jgi:hypothetical protein
MPDSLPPGARRPKSIPRPVVAPDVRDRECSTAAHTATRRLYRDWSPGKMVHATRDGERMFRNELASGGFLTSWNGLKGVEADTALVWLDEYFGPRFYQIALMLRALEADIAAALGTEPLLPPRSEDEDPLA